MPADPVERKLAAILAADVAGYSRLMGLDEVGTLQTLTACRRTIDGIIAQRRGRIFSTAGDSVLAEFASVVDAVQTAVDIQQTLGAGNADKPAERRMEFRVGVHVGDVMLQDGSLFGDGVNIAARLEALADPGGICVSGTVRDYVGSKLPIAFADMGEQSVKHITDKLRAYRIGPRTASPVSHADRPALALPEKPSIAVLPFQNIGGDPEQEYFADGMVEDIIGGLSRVGWLFVIARNSSFTYKGRPVDVKQVGHELGVRYVLEGSVRKAGARVRITGQLIDATTGGHIWAGRFDGALEDVFELQDRVTASAVGAIEPRLQRAEIERARRKPTESLDAYDYFLRGKASFYGFTSDSLSDARRLFRRATELDPDYASPYGMAAWCVHLGKTNGWLADHEIAEGVRLAGRAAALGRDDPTALWTGGHCLAYLGGEVETGATYIDRAISLNQNLAAAWNGSGWLCMYLGKPAVAIERFERAMRLNPLDPFAYFGCAGMAFAHVFADRCDEAASWATRAIHEQPNWATSLRAAAIAYALLGRIGEARDAMAKLRAIDPALRLGNIRRVAPPLRRPEDMARFTEGLRLAGLPD